MGHFQAALLLWILPSLAGAQSSWSTRFVLKDYLQEYVFPEQIVSYPISCPSGAVRRENLRLREEGAAAGLPFQLSEIVETNGSLTRAKVSFRASLAKGQQRTFVLDAEPANKPLQTPGIVLRDIDTAAHTAVIDAGSQLVKVPYGEFAPRAAFSAVPAPILQLSRDRTRWVGRGRLKGSAIVQRVAARVSEDGPLRLRYRIDYTLADQRTYAVVLTAQFKEAYITVNEYLDGIKLDDGLAFEFSYREGIDPDGRIAMGNNGGYLLRSGEYGSGVNAEGQLPYSLGIFGPNVACPRSTAFYRNQAGGDAILFSLYRLADWKTYVRHTWWTASVSEENLYFHNGPDKYMRARLAAKERHWAVSIVPREEIAIESQDGSRASYWYARNDMSGWDEKMSGGDPAARLFQRLGAYNLDWVKDLAFEFPEDVNVVYLNHREALTYDEFNRGGKPGNMWDGMFWWGGADWRARSLAVERYQDGMCYGAKSPGRTHWQTIAAYAASRATWTAEQRLKVRSWIVHFVATYMLLDDNLPHKSMLAGHPNFLIESLYPGVFAAVFPKHPLVGQFKETYREILDEYLRVYVRGENAELNALPGRHTESIACYSFASLQGVLHNAQGFRQVNGSDIIKLERFRNWMRWHLNTLITPGERESWEFDGNHLTLTPPEGAHASETWNVLHETAEYFKTAGDPLGGELEWALTKGLKGTKPDLRSHLFQDYGPVLRYDFGGPHEAYLHMQHLGNSDPIEGYRISGLNYRWRPEGNGTLYYAARGRTWSWNKKEDNGDKFDIKGLSAFDVPGGVFSYRKLDASSSFLDLGGVQFFRSSEVTDPKNPYLSRAVLMVRDAFIAVYDDLRDSRADGAFRWINRTDGARVEYFDNPDFTKPTATRVDAGRFTIRYNPPGMGPASNSSEWSKAGFTSNDDYSARFTTRVRPEWDKVEFEHELGPTDSARLWVDGKLVLDGASGGRGAVTLVAGRDYDLRYEFVHRSGPVRAILRWGQAGTKLRELEGVSCTWNRELPAIYEVRGGPGDELHIVEPSVKPTLKVAATAYGATVKSGNAVEYVFLTDHAGESRDGGMQFRGKTGYARQNDLALIEGTRLFLDSFGIETSSVDLAVSAVLRSPQKIEGRIAGRNGGRVSITVPKQFDAASKQVRVGGEIVKSSFDPAAGRFSFDVSVTRADGYKEYSISQ